MNRAKSNRSPHKDRIANRARSINTLLLALALVLITGTAAMIVAGINNDASKNLARSYSLEAAKTLYSYIAQDLILVRKAAHSTAVTDWFADEGNQAKRATAYNEMMDYIGMLQNAHLYFGINASLNEYSITEGATLPGFAPFARLSLENPKDAWYFDCIASTTAYVFHIDFDKFTHRWKLWINHKVMADGKLVGVFAAGLQMQSLLHNMFDKYDAKNVKGYVIDRQGVILMDNALSELDVPEGKRRIHELSPDSAFASAIDAYLQRIDVFFDPQAQQEVVTLAGGSFGYASIAPIAGADWSVVIFFNNDWLSGVSHLLPLSIALLSALFLYVAARNVLMRQLIFTPLNRLTQSISEAKPDAADIFGNERDDEIGELARTIRGVWERHNTCNAELLHAKRERQRLTQLLHALDSMVAPLLSTTDEKVFAASLLESMERIGRCIDVDRVYIWRNETLDGALYYILQHEWLSELGRQGKTVPNKTKFPYGDHPQWADKLLRGECIRGPLIALPRDEQTLLRPYGVRSVLIIPVYLQKHFWGFVSFDDCRQDRAFTEDELSILRSASLLLVSAIQRNAQAESH